MAFLAPAIPYIMQAATVVSAAAAAKQAFGGGRGSPRAKEPAVMPDPKDIEARNRRMRAMALQSGRSNTILSQGDGEALGG